MLSKEIFNIGPENNQRNRTKKDKRKGKAEIKQKKRKQNDYMHKTQEIFKKSKLKNVANTIASF